MIEEGGKRAKEGVRDNRDQKTSRDQKNPVRTRAKNGNVPWGGTAALTGDEDDAPQIPPPNSGKEAVPLTTFSSEDDSKRRRLLAGCWWCCCPNASAISCSDVCAESCSIMVRTDAAAVPAAAATADVPGSGEPKAKGRLVPAWGGKGRGEATSIVGIVC